MSPSAKTVTTGDYLNSPASYRFQNSPGGIGPRPPSILALVALMGSSGPRVSKNLLRGEEYLKAGEWDAARQLFEHVLSREPGNERAKRGLAIATAQHDAQREIDELRRELERAQRNLSEDERRRLEERLRAVEQRARASPTPAPQR